MIEVLHRSSMPPSALPPFNNNPLGNQQTRPPLRAIVNGPNGSTIKGQPERVASWIEDTRRNSNGSAPAHSYLQTPPGTDVVSVNSMLAPMYGGLYRGNSYSGYSNNIPTRQSSPPIPSISPRTKDDHPSCRDGIESIDGTNQIVSYLQIPPSINNSKGSLSEFAAQVRSHSTAPGPMTQLDSAVLTDKLAR